MIKLRTATGAEFPISWIGVSDFDGSLRFEVLAPADLAVILLSGGLTAAICAVLQPKKT